MIQVLLETFNACVCTLRSDRKPLTNPRGDLRTLPVPKCKEKTESQKNQTSLLPEMSRLSNLK